MDVPVISAIMLVSLALVFGVIVPLLNLRRRRQRDEHLTAFAATVGGGAPAGVSIPWAEAPQRGVEFEWRGRRAAYVFCEQGRYDLGWLLLRDVSLPRIHARRETSLDRIGKRLGLNREVQVGDPGFDARVYLETDESDALVKRALGAPKTRSALEALLGGEHPHAHLGPGGAAVRLGRGDGAPPSRDDLDQALDGLAAFADVAPSVDAAEVAPPRRARGDVMLVGALAAFVVSLFAMYALPVGYADYRSPLLARDQHAALAFTSGAWLLLVPITWLWVRGHSRSFRNFLGVVLLGLFPLVVLGTEALFLLNATLDRGVAAEHEVTVARRRSPARKSEHRYLYIPWWGPSGGELELEVSAATFRGMHEGDAVSLDVRPGAFGWPWVERLRRVRPAPSIGFTARVRSVTGHAPVGRGAACAFRVARRPAQAGYRCQTEVTCGAARLYGSDTQGYFSCHFDAKASAVSGSDAETSRADRTPAMNVDTLAGTMSVWDDRRRGAWRVELDVAAGR